MQQRISIINIPAVSAIYYALLQCGYDYYTMEKDADLVSAIESFRTTECNPFFLKVRQDTCEVYPYWPRAAMLETAAFYLDNVHLRFRAFDEYRKFIMSASNISDAERNQAFWDWVEGFPAAVGSILSNKEFRTYLDWENEWIQQQNRNREDDLLHAQSIIDICNSAFASPVHKVAVILNPIKCAYSADYYLHGGELFFSSGAFRLESVIHEFLHQIVRPIVDEHKEAIHQSRTPYPGIDNSYYLAGKLNAFEEYAVRKLTNDVIAQNFPTNLDGYIAEILRDLC